jgi:Holliday junction resolvase RusA-like endonuclease
VTILIPGRPPTPNARPGNYHAERKAFREWKDSAYLVAKDAVNREGWQTPGTVRLVVTFHLPDRIRRDLDNLIASTKPLTDGLVAAGVMADDSVAVIESIRYQWRMSPGYAGTEYEVTPGSVTGGLWG